MPAIQLTEAAQQNLKSYPWPGNVRQLKNVTEQISIIERNREITPEILQAYIPEQIMSQMPALVRSGGNASSGKTFESEREILYQILFDLRRDVTELKKLVHSNLEQQSAAPQHTPYIAEEQTVHYPVLSPQDSAVPATINIHKTATVQPKVVDTDSDIQDTEEYVEESLSLNDLERDMIRKALEKHHGKRKSAAKDLHISERTLYRKIKEYGLE